VTSAVAGHKVVRVTWTGFVWSLAPLGGYEAPQQELGHQTFPDEPEVGSVLEIDGERYQVVAVGDGYCNVAPMKPI
jgi:hypothetical protein